MKLPKIKRTLAALMVAMLSASFVSMAALDSAAQSDTVSEAVINANTIAADTITADTIASDTEASEKEAPESDNANTNDSELEETAAAGEEKQETDTNTQTEDQSNEETEAASEETKETEETQEAEETEEIDETQESTADKTNEMLIAEQDIVDVPEYKECFRFETVEKVYASALYFQTYVYEEMDEESAYVGRMQKNFICFILDDTYEEEGWIYIESGKVRGFVAADAIVRLTDEETEERYETPRYVRYAWPMMDPLENSALTFTKTTIYDAVVEKDYAIALKETDILESMYNEESEEIRVIGTLEYDGLCFILDDVDEDWYFVESGDVRGFVQKDSLLTGDDAEKYMEVTEEDSYPLANEYIEPEDNAACYYTLTSVTEVDSASLLRKSLLEYAVKFLGNPYVWGGTSLTSGTDCSGFVQSLYKAYGYTLPRVAEDQAQYGTKIAVEDAAPGDLIFYARNGYIYHVVMYIGDGKVIHASSSRTGIIISNLSTSSAVWATRILE